MQNTCTVKVQGHLHLQAVWLLQPVDALLPCGMGAVAPNLKTQQEHAERLAVKEGVARELRQHDRLSRCALYSALRVHAVHA